MTAQIELVDLVRSWLTVYISAFLPFIGMHGAVVVAAATHVDWRAAWLLTTAGTLTAAAIVLRIDRATVERARHLPVFERLFEAADHYIQNRDNSKDGHIYRTIAMIIAVPMTGVGTLVACIIVKLLDLDYRRSLLSISVGAAVNVFLTTAGVYGLLAGLQTILGAIFGF